MVLLKKSSEFVIFNNLQLYVHHGLQMHMKPVLVCLSCHNRISQTGCFKQQIYFLTILEGGSPRSRCRQGQFLVNLSLSSWLSDHFLFALPSHGLPSVQMCSWCHSQKDTSLLDQGLTVMTVFNYLLRGTIFKYCHIVGLVL